MSAGAAPQTAPAADRIFAGIQRPLRIVSPRHAFSASHQQAFPLDVRTLSTDSLSSVSVWYSYSSRIPSFAPPFSECICADDTRV